jgi:nucleoside-diphosphate-sugar epimerase
MLNSMSRCLITGASGFVGSNLTARLRDEGWDVRCLVRSTSRIEPLEKLGVELINGSLHDSDSLTGAVRNVDTVFHVAGRTAALRAAEYDRDNVEVTRLVAQACAAQSQPPVLVMVSSLAAGGPGTPRAPRQETDSEAPVSHYGRSKLAAERAAAETAGDVPTSVVRPPMVFGPGDRASLQIYRGMKFLPVHPSPGFRRFPVSLVHVSDLCDALVRVAQNGERLPAGGDGSAAGVGKYYVAADRSITYGELGQLAARAAGWAIAPLPLPRTIFWIAGSIGEVMGRVRGRAAVLNLDKIREATARGWVCSDAKIRSQLGYAPTGPLEDRFAETVAWYREHNWL